MDRREAMTLLGALPFAADPAAAPARAAGAGAIPAYWKSRLVDVDEVVGRVAKGKAGVLTVSPGRRKVYLVTYGEKRPLRSTANYNSACAGGDPACYAAKDGKQPPVVFLLGPVHGAEFEGTVGLLNLIRVAESGTDFRGRPWPGLAERFARCRVLIVPTGNPDGRARCRFDSWVGEDLKVNERVGMGTRPDGENYQWPGVKRVHPMRGAAFGELGAYFNDAGVNLMHDEWFAPMAPETRAFLDLARDEAPDLIVSFHSHASAPSVEPTAYVPATVKESIRQISDRAQSRFAAANLPHRSHGPRVTVDGETFPPPSFNLSSALHHCCGGVSFVYECSVGTKTPPHPQLTHEQILDAQLLFLDELFRFAVESPVKWTSDLR
jgi:hypothetical protein